MVAANLDNLIFLLLIGVAALFQLLSKAISKSGKSGSKTRSSPPQAQTPRPIPRTAGESDSDRIRKFLEALGQPPSSTPPSPVLPRSDIPPRPLAPVHPPPVMVPGRLGSPQQTRKKTDVAPKDARSPEMPMRRAKTIPLPVSVPVPSAFEVHKTLSKELQQPTNVTGMQTYAPAKSSRIANATGSEIDMLALLESKSMLRQMIVLREILGPPRGLQSMDATP